VYPLYETDFYAWTQQQIRLLKERRLEQLDAVAGFAHQAHMTNVPSRLYGLTPARIRNREGR
jgi:AraC-like DNA-binding protein